MTIVAAGDITSGANGQLIATDGTNGAAITVIAGANITPCSTCTANSTLPATSGVTRSQSITVNLADGLGGNIDFSASTANNLIDSAAPGINGNGGFITLIAVGGIGKGEILLPSSGTTNASGSGTGMPGSVWMIAGATSGTAIQSGAITVAGNASASSKTRAGSVQLVTGAFANNTGAVLTANYAGTVSATGSLSLATFVPGNFVESDIVTNGAINISSGYLAIEAGNNLTINQAISAPVIVAQAGLAGTGNLNVNANLTTTSVMALEQYSNGNIALAANLASYAGTTTGGIIEFTSYLLGNIQTVSGVSVTAPTVTLTMGTGDVGSGSLPLTLNCSTLTFNGQGNFYLQNASSAISVYGSNIILPYAVPGTTAPTAFGTISAMNNFSLLSAGYINVASGWTGNSVAIKTTSGSDGNIVISGYLDEMGDVNLSAGGTGSVTIARKLYANTVEIKAYELTLSGGIAGFSGAATSVTITPDNGQAIDLGTGTIGDLIIPAQTMGIINATNLTIGDPSTSGALTIGSAVSFTQANVQLNSAQAITATAYGTVRQILFSV